MAISAHLDPLQPAPCYQPTGFSHAQLVEVQKTKLNIWYGPHYKAACELTIDDSMIGTKCILHYLLKKPTNGEVQVCADAATSYSTALSIYIGKYQFIQLQLGRSSTVKSKL